MKCSKNYKKVKNSGVRRTGSAKTSCGVGLPVLKEEHTCPCLYQKEGSRVL